MVHQWQNKRETDRSMESEPKLHESIWVSKPTVDAVRQSLIQRTTIHADAEPDEWEGERQWWRECEEVGEGCGQTDSSDRWTEEGVEQDWSDGHLDPGSQQGQ